MPEIDIQKQFNEEYITNQTEVNIKKLKIIAIHFFLSNCYVKEAIARIENQFRGNRRIAFLLYAEERKVRHMHSFSIGIDIGSVLLK